MKNCLTLYHATLNLDPIEIFVPRVPENRCSVEDDEIPRICLSETINGCLSATDWGGIQFEEIMHPNGFSKLIRIYEFDITEDMMKNLEFPSTLYEKDLVRDAEINKEYWYKNSALKPSRTYLIKVTDFFESVNDNISFENWEKINGDELDYNDAMEGCFTSIEAEYEIVDEKNIAKICEIEAIIISEEQINKSDVIDSLINHIDLGYCLDNLTQITIEELKSNKESLDFYYKLVGVIDLTSYGIYDIENLYDILEEELPYYVELKDLKVKNI